MSDFCEWYKKIWFDSDLDKKKSFEALGEHIQSCPQCQDALGKVSINISIEVSKKDLMYEDMEGH
jgi:hypothetical protein